MEPRIYIGFVAFISVIQGQKANAYVMYVRQQNYCRANQDWQWSNTMFTIAK